MFRHNVGDVMNVMACFRSDNQQQSCGGVANDSNNQRNVGIGMFDDDNVMTKQTNIKQPVNEQNSGNKQWRA